MFELLRKGSMQRLQGKKGLILAEDLYEEMELWYPWYRLIEEGAELSIAAPEDRVYRGKNGYPVTPDLTVDEARAGQFDVLIIPGGFAPDKLRRYGRVVELTREMYDGGKLVAFICHAGWVPVSAKILNGKKVTGFFSIKDDLENAGAVYQDREVVVDGNLISSRTPKDLPAFCRAIIDYFSG
jgi:protease I